MGAVRPVSVAAGANRCGPSMISSCSSAPSRPGRPAACSVSDRRSRSDSVWLVALPPGGRLIDAQRLVAAVLDDQRPGPRCSLAAAPLAVTVKDVAACAHLAGAGVDVQVVDRADDAEAEAALAMTVPSRAWRTVNCRRASRRRPAPQQDVDGGQAGAEVTTCDPERLSGPVNR